MRLKEGSFGLTSMNFLSKHINLIASILTATTLFINVQPIMVEALVENSEPLNNKYEVTTKADENEFRQIILRNQNGETKQITQENTTHADPAIDGNLVVWMQIVDSKWQIFIYNTLTDKKIQITTEGNNVNPRISEGIIVWEGLHKGTWQIYSFDGKKINRLTDGDVPKQNADINYGNVIYTQVENSKNKLVHKNLETGETQVLEQELDAFKPFFRGRSVIWRGISSGTDEYNEYDTYSNKLSAKKNKDDSLESPEVAAAETNIEETNYKPEEIKKVTQEEIKSEVEEIISEIINETDVNETTPSNTTNKIVVETEEVLETTESAN